MQEHRLIEALTRNSLYTFEFDVSTGLIETGIKSRSGVNFTDVLGIEVPCSFDTMMERAFGEALQCRYTSESAGTNLSRQGLLDAYEKGKTKLEANIFYAAWNKYVRITYLLSRNPENGHVLSYVICDDVTGLEQMRGDSLHLEFTSRNRAKAKVAANYLLSLINDVLQLSKLEDPDVTLSYEAFNARKLAEDILTIIKMRAVDHGITVEYEKDPNVFAYPYIWGSPPACTADFYQHSQQCHQIQ